MCVNGSLSVLPYADKDIFIGFTTKLRLQKLLEEGCISSTDVTMFYQTVRAFYVRAMEYAIHNLPLKDDLLKNASFVNFKSRENAQFCQVEYFVERYVN